MIVNDGRQVTTITKRHNQGISSKTKRRIASGLVSTSRCSAHEFAHTHTLIDLFDNGAVLLPFLGAAGMGSLMGVPTHQEQFFDSQDLVVPAF